MSARALALVAALVALVHALGFLGYGPFDDDWIVHRYARNWVDGRGLVFDPGERIEGFTIPLWVMLVVIGLLARVPPELTSLVGCIAGSVLACLAIARVGRDGPERRAALAAAWLWALSPAAAWHANQGLGTTALAGLLAAWLALLDRDERAGRAPLAAGWALGAAGLLRAEALAFAIGHALVAARPRGDRAGRALAVALPFAPVAAWQVFRWAYYGRSTPISFSVKKLAFEDDLYYGVRYLGEATLETGIGLALVLAAPALVAMKRTSWGAGRAAVLGLGLFVAFVVWVGGDFVPLARFLVPVLPIAYLVGARGALALAPLDRPRVRWALLALAALALQWPQLRRPALLERHRREELRWVAVGRELGRTFPPDTTVATSPIGAIGYWSELPIVDILGLTNDAVWRTEPDLAIDLKGHHRHDGDWVLAQRPDLLVLGNAVLDVDPRTGERRRFVVSAWERDIWEHPDFAQSYEPVTMEVEGSYRLLFWIRRDLPLPPGVRPAE